MNQFQLPVNGALLVAGAGGDCGDATDVTANETGAGTSAAVGELNACVVFVEGPRPIVLKIFFSECVHDDRVNLP